MNRLTAVPAAPEGCFALGCLGAGLVGGAQLMWSLWNPRLGAKPLLLGA